MKTKEEIVKELELLDRLRSNLQKKFASLNTEHGVSNVNESVDSVMNGLTTLIKYYTLSWVLEKSSKEELLYFEKKIKEEYIKPLAQLMKQQATKELK